MTDLELAKKAYEAYSKYLGIKMEFETLAEVLQNAWKVVVIEIENTIKEENKC